MYIRRKVYSYKWPVNVRFPTDGGVYKSETFTATFCRMKKQELESLDEIGDDVFLEKILLGWEDINDEDGKPVVCSKSNKAELMEDPYWRRSVIEAYFASYNEASAKNS